MESANSLEEFTLFWDKLSTVYNKLFIFSFSYGKSSSEFKFLIPTKLIKSWNISPIVLRQLLTIDTVPFVCENMISISLFSYQLENLNFISFWFSNLYYSFLEMFIKKHCFNQIKYLEFLYISLNFNFPEIYCFGLGSSPHFQNFVKNIGIFLISYFVADCEECTII